MNQRRSIWITSHLLLALFMLVQTTYGQVVPDSVLQKIPFPVLGPNDTIPVPAQVYNNSEIVPSQTLEWAWVSALYPKHLLEKRRVCYLSLRAKSRIHNK